MQSAPAQGPPGPRPMQLPPEQVKAMQTIFPQYLDAELTPSEGRRLTKAQAVSTPTIDEIILALRQLGYRNICVDARKSLPRAQGNTKFPLVPRGCVKVMIKEPHTEHYIKKSEFDTNTRASVVSGLDSKHQVLVKIAATIKERGGERPKLPSVAEVLAIATPNQPKTKK